MNVNIDVTSGNDVIMYYEHPLSMTQNPAVWCRLKDLSRLPMKPPIFGLKSRGNFSLTYCGNVVCLLQDSDLVAFLSQVKGCAKAHHSSTDDYSTFPAQSIHFNALYLILVDFQC